MSEEMNLYKRCKNIFKFHGVDMGGGESAPEVENAIETHGLGWTGTEEKAGFDIQWDGNTEGLESQYSMYRVTNDVYGITSSNDLIGVHVTTIENGEESTFVLTEDNIMPIDDDGKMVNLSDSTGTIGMVAIEDVTMGSSLIKRGFWLSCADPDEYSFYTSRFYKEATTEEVVHQIDQKYIPGGSGGGSEQTVVKIKLTANPEAESDDSPYIIESDLTTSEIEEAFKSSNVVAWVYSKSVEDEWMKQYQLNCAACLNLGEAPMVVFTAIMNMGFGANILTLSVMGEEWNFSATPIPQETN